MGTHSLCPLHPPLPRQGQALTMPPQPASGLDTMPLFRFIASPRSPAGFPGLFGIYITLASRGDFFFYLKIVCGRAWGGLDGSGFSSEYLNIFYNVFLSRHFALSTLLLQLSFTCQPGPQHGCQLRKERKTGCSMVASIC